MRKIKMDCRVCKIIIVILFSIGVTACGGGGARTGAADLLDLPGGANNGSQIDYPVSTTLYKIESCESTPVCFGPDDESKVTASGGYRFKSCDWDCAAEYKEFSNRAVSVMFMKYQRRDYINGYGWVDRGNCWGVDHDIVSEACY